MKDACYDPMLLGNRSVVTFLGWHCAPKFERLGYGLKRLRQVMQFCGATAMQRGVESVANVSGGTMRPVIEDRFNPSKGFVRAKKHERFIQSKLRAERVLEESPRRIDDADREVQSLESQISRMREQISEIHRERVEITKEMVDAQRFLSKFPHILEDDKDAAFAEHMLFNKDWAVMRTVLRTDFRDKSPASDDGAVDAASAVMSDVVSVATEFYSSR